MNVPRAPWTPKLEAAFVVRSLSRVRLRDPMGCSTPGAYYQQIFLKRKKKKKKALLLLKLEEKVPLPVT